MPPTRIVRPSTARSSPLPPDRSAIRSTGVSTTAPAATNPPYRSVYRRRRVREAQALRSRGDSVSFSLVRSVELCGYILSSLGGSLSDAGERFDGKDHFHRYLEMAGDPQSQVEAGAVLAPFEVADGLVVHAQGLGQLAAGDPTFGSQHGDPVVDGFCVPVGRPATTVPLLVVSSHASSLPLGLLGPANPTAVEPFAAVPSVRGGTRARPTATGPPRRAATARPRTGRTPGVPRKRQRPAGLRRSSGAERPWQSSGAMPVCTPRGSRYPRSARSP